MSGFRGAATLRARALTGQKLLTKAEIERTYGVSSETVTRLIETGALLPTRVGKIDRVAEVDWLSYLATGRPAAAAGGK